MASGFLAGFDGAVGAVASAAVLAALAGFACAVRAGARAGVLAALGAFAGVVGAGVRAAVLEALANFAGVVGAGTRVTVLAALAARTAFAGVVGAGASAAALAALTMGAAMMHWCRAPVTARWSGLRAVATPIRRDHDDETVGRRRSGCSACRTSACGTVADFFNIKVADMQFGGIACEYCAVTLTAMYLAKQLTQKSLPEIGELLGGRDHTNVRHALRNIVWTGTRNDGDQLGAKIGYIDVEQYLHNNSASTNSSFLRCGVRSTCC